MSANAPQHRIWVVSELYYPEETSTGYFLTAIAEGLAVDGGATIHAVCARPSYSERGISVAAREKRRGVTIHRMRATHFDKDRLLLRVVNAASFALSTILFAIRHFRRGDALLIVTNPPILPLPIGLIAKAKGMRRVLLVHDVYPDVLAAVGMVREGGAVWRILSAVFARAYAFYDTVVVLGRDMRELIGDKIAHLARPPALVIVPNWGDSDDIKPMERADNPFAVDHGLTGKRVVQFSGNLGRTHDLELVLEVARRCEDLTDVVFLFVGYGGQASKAAAGSERRNVMYLPRQPRERLAAMLSCSDCTVIAFRPQMRGISVPSRMYNVLAAGVPIAAIGDGESEMALAVGEARAGWSLAPGDAAGLEAVVRSLVTPAGIATARALGENARRAAVEHYSRDRIIARYRQLFDGMGTKQPSAPGVTHPSESASHH